MEKININYGNCFYEDLNKNIVKFNYKIFY